MRPTIATLARVESGERWANLSMRRWLVAICRLSTTQRVRYSWRGAADYGAQPLRWLRSSLPLGGSKFDCGALFHRDPFKKEVCHALRIQDRNYRGVLVRRASYG